jgi:WD repeat-containing protein 35
MCNSIGSPVESKYIPIEPTFVTMTDCHVIVASESNIFIWQYRAQFSKSNETVNIAMNSALRSKEEVEYIFHIDETNLKPYKGGGFKLS